MDGITDFARLERAMQRLEGHRGAPAGAPEAAAGLLDPQGRPVSSLGLAQRPLTLADCVTTAKEAYTKPNIPRSYLVEPIIPTGKGTLLVGDSGIGKTPLLFQLGLCIAGGRTFLNMPVKQGPVLYIDWESADEHAYDYLRSLHTFLGLPQGADTPFYVHGMWSQWPNPRQQDPLERVNTLVAEYKPVLVIFDGLRVLWKDAESNNREAQKMWDYHRELWKQGIATLLVHHLRKPPVDSKTGREAGVKLQDEPREWLRNLAGTGALLNAVESRIGVALWKGKADGESTLAIRGFAKSTGLYDLAVAERVYDASKKPCGYYINVQALRERLGDNQKALLEALPASYRHRDMVQIATGLFQVSPTTADRIHKDLLEAQYVVKDRTGDYRKI
jgi:hypothetical protein